MRVGRGVAVGVDVTIAREEARAALCCSVSVLSSILKSMNTNRIDPYRKHYLLTLARD